MEGVQYGSPLKVFVYSCDISVSKGGNSVTCDLCQKSFTSISIMKRHKSDGVCLEKHDHKCPFCWKYYQLKSLLDNHIQSVHEGIKEIKKPKTEECD